MTENANQISHNQQLMPSEEMLEVKAKHQSITIGIPSNIDKFEYCIPLTPTAVKIVTALGHDVLIEAGAGEKANYTNADYIEAGAVVTNSKAEVYQCDYILKVAPFDQEEIALLKGNQILFSGLHLNRHSAASIRELMSKKVTTIAFEYMKDDYGFHPVMNTLSEISGNVAINIASYYLSNKSGGKGVLFGGVTGISPAEVIILGAGMTARSAVKAALGMGVGVKVFDDSIHQLRAFSNSFNQSIFTSTYYPELLKKALRSADAVISAQPFDEEPSLVVSEEMVQEMKPGSVIIDLNVTQGGSFATSECTSLDNPLYEKYGVLHYCVPNIYAQVARTSSIALSNIFTPIISTISGIGGINNYIRANANFRKGVYIYSGILTNQHVGNRFMMEAKDIDLLMAVF